MTARQTFEQLLTVETDDCVLWPHSTNSKGYGQLNFGGIKHVHVLACTHHHGDKPTPLHEVAHGCGVRHCMNYHHLRWATRSENALDRRLHGTDPRGSKSASAKLTEEQALRVLTDTDVSGKEWAQRLGVSQTTISEIRHRKVWQHLEVPA